jgi:hypothetical protein
MGSRTPLLPLLYIRYDENKNIKAILRFVEIEEKRQLARSIVIPQRPTIST